MQTAEYFHYLNRLYSMGHQLRPCSESCSDKHTEMVSSKGFPPINPKNNQPALPTFPNDTIPSPHMALQHEEQPRKSSITQSACLKMSEIKIVCESEGSDVDQLVITPFETIKAAMTAGMERVMQKHCREMMRKFEGAGSRWHRNSKGYYLNWLAPHFLYVFTDSLYFEGTVSPIEGNYLPQEDGIMVTQQGIYRGTFKDGAAHGRGRYTTEQAVTFEGEWIDGLMASGTIESPKFKFTGELIKGVVEGRGKLRFKNGEVEYEGTFKEGLFDGDNCYYKCKEYEYRGDFRAGKKDGYGVIFEPQFYGVRKNSKHPKRSYKPPSKLKGKWRNDSLIAQLPLC